MNEEPDGRDGLPALPRWFWLLPLLAVAAWWPIDPYWASDDFIALHYANDFANALRDFTGPQYGASDLWFFYRPLITLSFWFDLTVAGSDPFFSHLSNVLAHGASALLVGLIWRRFLPDHAAFAAGLLWAMMPGHLGAVAWAVGRVDSHTTVWCLLALWLLLRQCDRARNGETAARWPAVLAAALALLSKESAFVLPPAAMLLALCRSGEGLLTRLQFALRQSAPLWALFALYLGLRFLVLGRLGGYLEARPDLAAIPHGLYTYLANILLPLRYAGSQTLAEWGLSRWMWTTVAAIPLVWAGLHLVLQPRRLLIVTLLFLGAIAPVATFLHAADNVQTLRFFYLPSVVLAGVLAAPGRIATALLLLTWCVPFYALREQQRDADRESAAMHLAMLKEAADGAPSPMFVAGLPHANQNGTVVQLHFGVDRMLEPPFGPGGTRLYALRPLAEFPGVFRSWPDDEPRTLPVGSTWFFADPTAFGRAAPPPPLPKLTITGDEDGVVDLSTPRLLLLAEEKLGIQLRTPGVRPQAFRLTLLTANGYLSCLFPDHGQTPGNDGTIDLRAMFGGRPPDLPPAAWGIGNYFGDGTVLPATMDLDPEFPALLEAGQMEGAHFLPSHRADRLLRFRFDRGYADWVRLVQGRK